ncbi:MAG: hypothetical protein ACFFB0_14065 [Promethearchaeota archaeon]
MEEKEVKEFCPKCGSILEDNNYIYRHKAPSGYKCYKCGYFEFYSE